ncbi:MAG: carboxypeptidase regulatory-like domain-containing protein [Cyclobacteriaceae bacterium]|nr:TonB-dependent receptor [Cyclobacteriaceae bacterium]MCH8515580.1 carboxypeptidase regulatory-like domain-containing protein [Cyclobacteriaceae bacterium]
MKKTALLLCTAIALVIGSFASEVFAQGVTSASIRGSVFDENGEGLPGANVVAVHEPSGTRYGATTSIDGKFTMPNVRVGGPYSITASFVGYPNQRLEDVNLALGQRFSIDFDMEPISQELEEITIVDNRLINSDRTGASTNLGQERMTTMPTINRSLNDFTRLTPQSNGQSFGGANNRFNNYSIDGNIYNDNFGLGGQLAGGNPISIDVIEEIQVNIAPYDVRQSGFTGAGINAITKSGTNRFKASAYNVFNNQNTRGRTLNGGQEIPVPNVSSQIYGATVGGPIIKDKLFFFAGFEYETEDLPGDTRRAARPEQGLFQNREQRIARMTADQAQFVSDQMFDLFGYETGPFELYPFDNEETRLNLRLDYNLNDRNKVSLRYNRYFQTRDISVNANSIRGDIPRFTNTSRGGVEALTFRNGNYTADHNVQSIVAEWNSSISNKMANRLSVGYTADVRERGIPGGQTFPFVEVLENTGAGPEYFMSLGTELFSRGNLLDQRTFNITNDFNYFAGKHTITAGVNFEFMTFENAFNPVWDGFYRFESFGNFQRAVLGIDPATGAALSEADQLAVIPDAFAIGFTYDADNPTTLPVDRTAFGQVGIYIQDEFQVNRDLKLTGGLRIELPFYPVDAPANPRLDELGLQVPDPRNPENLIEPRVDVFPRLTPVWSPRFGFNWDALSDGTLQVRGGTGLFTGRPIFVHLSNQINGNGITRGQLGINQDQWGTEGFPEWQGFQSDINFYRPDPSEQEPVISDNINLTDPNFRIPQVWRTNLAADYAFGDGWVFTVEGIYSRDYNSPFAVNLTRQPTDDVVLVGNEEYPIWRQQRLATNPGGGGGIGDMFFLTNINDGTYKALTFSLQKDWGQGIFTSLAYTRSQKRDFGLGGGSQAGSLWPQPTQVGRNVIEEGYSVTDQPNRVVGLISFNTKGINQLNNTSFNLFYDGGEQNRFSYVYSGQMTGEQAGVSLFYVPSSFEDAQLIDRVQGGAIVQTAEEQWNILDQYIEQDPYLRTKRGQVTERNGAVLPWLHRFDFSVIQTIHLAKDVNKHRLELRFDVFNVGNMMRDSWGVGVGTVQRAPLNFEGTDANGRAQFTLNTIAGEAGVFPVETAIPLFTLGQAWRGQTTVRYIF